MKYFICSCSRLLHTNLEQELITYSTWWNFDTWQPIARMFNAWHNKVLVTISSYYIKVQNTKGDKATQTIQFKMYVAFCWLLPVTVLYILTHICKCFEGKTESLISHKKDYNNNNTTTILFVFIQLWWILTRHIDTFPSRASRGHISMEQSRCPYGISWEESADEHSNLDHLVEVWRPPFL